jgi:hypothetical protein
MCAVIYSVAAFEWKILTAVGTSRGGREGDIGLRYGHRGGREGEIRYAHTGAWDGCASAARIQVRDDGRDSTSQTLH